MRRGLGVALTVALGSLGLAACGSTTSAVTTVTGQPSLQISVPLQVAACDGAGNCYAVGTSGLDSAPTSAGEVTANSKTWINVATPTAPSTIISAAGCWSNGCLFAGSNANGDVVWRTNGSTSITVAAAPASGLGVTAVSCFAPSHCGVLDTSSLGAMRVSFTSDGGATWSMPRIVTAPSGAIGLSLTCIDAVHCVIGEGGAMSVGTGAAWTATSDSFATTTSGSSFPSGTAWTQLVIASCTASRCVGRLSDGESTTKVAVANLTGSWFSSNPRWGSHLNIPITVDAVACTSQLRCVATGSSNANGAVWVSHGDGTWSSVPLKYVGDPLTGAACSTTRCIAVNSTTVTAFAP